MKRLLSLLLVMGMVGCGGQDAAPQPAATAENPAPEAASSLRLLQIDQWKRSPGKTAIDVFVVNQTSEPITVYRDSSKPHIYLAVQIKQPNGKVFRLIDAYPTRDIALFDKNFIKVAPGKELKLCSYEFGLMAKSGETWKGDRGDSTSRLSFDAKGKYQLWFSYGGGSPFSYTEVSKGEFADLKHGTQFGPVTIEVELK